MSTAAFFRLAVATGLAVGVLNALIGALLVPPRPVYVLVTFWLVPLMLLLWAQADRRERGLKSVAGLHGGVWFLVAGVFLIPYYLWQTRRSHTRSLVLIVLLALGAPFLGEAIGRYGAPRLGIPPRYVQLDVNGPFVLITADVADEIVARDFLRLERIVGAAWTDGTGLPIDVWDLYERVQRAAPNALLPLDPHTGVGYHYETIDHGGYGLWATGPDREFGTEDDYWLNWWPDSVFTNTR